MGARPRRPCLECTRRSARLTHDGREGPYFLPMRLGRRSALQPLDEAAAYARCHGARSRDVRIVKLPPRRARYTEVLATGEELRALFEQRLDARDSESPPS